MDKKKKGPLTENGFEEVAFADISLLQVRGGLHVYLPVIFDHYQFCFIECMFHSLTIGIDWLKEKAHWSPNHGCVAVVLKKALLLEARATTLSESQESY